MVSDFWTPLYIACLLYHMPSCLFSVSFINLFHFWLVYPKRGHLCSICAHFAVNKHCPNSCNGLIISPSTYQLGCRHILCYPHSSHTLCVVLSQVNGNQILCWSSGFSSVWKHYFSFQFCILLEVFLFLVLHCWYVRVCVDLPFSVLLVALRLTLL